MNAKVRSWLDFVAADLVSPQVPKLVAGAAAFHPCWVSMPTSRNAEPIAVGPFWLVPLGSKGPHGSFKNAAKARWVRYDFGAACNVTNGNEPTPQADIRRCEQHVRFGPIADIGQAQLVSYSMTSSARPSTARRECETHCLGGLKIDY
jgi:hypothetical protein